MFDSLITWSLLPLIGLGIFHGLNPGMGWLFAVAIGMQGKSARAVVTALGPIALGHALAIGVVALAVWLLGAFIPTVQLLIVSGFVLLAFGGYKVASRFRHPAWVGMRVSHKELALWSFLMATAHGAGLMLVPVVLRMRGDAESGAVVHGHHDHHAHHVAEVTEPLSTAFLAVGGVHTLAMIATAFLLAVIVYSFVGVGLLRKAWINLDWIWVGAVIITGGVTLGMGVAQLL